MGEIRVRPDIRTSGGEVSDIVVNGRYAGMLTLVYREHDRLSGSVQLDSDALDPEDKDEVSRFIEDYTRNLADAMAIERFELTLTYSPYDDILEMAESVEDTPAGRDRRIPAAAVEDEGRHDGETSIYELAITGESRDHVEYQVYDEDRDILAEAEVRFSGSDAVGEVHWMHWPTDEQMEHVSDLLISDFDDTQVETITIDMLHEGRLVETLDLVRQDLLDDQSFWDEEDAIEGEMVDADWEDYSIRMVRDDGDALTYDIYRQSHGGLPIATAVVDISKRQISGIVDLAEPSEPPEREVIAAMLVGELDKEKEFRIANLTILHKNEPIDEIRFDTETVH